MVVVVVVVLLVVVVEVVDEEDNNEVCDYLNAGFKQSSKLQSLGRLGYLFQLGQLVHLVAEESWPELH